MAPVDFINVRKSFGAVPIIKGVNIEIADGACADVNSLVTLTKKKA